MVHVLSNGAYIIPAQYLLQASLQGQIWTTLGRGALGAKAGYAKIKKLEGPN